MKQLCVIFTIALLLTAPCWGDTVVVGFDDVSGPLLNHYRQTYGVVFANGARSESHAGSDWGPPRSGTNVLVADSVAEQFGFASFALKWPYPSLHLLFAGSVGAYFSTEPGVVLQMVGHHRWTDNVVASVTIGSLGESWNNVYVQIDSPAGISGVDIYPVTDHALLHFCADDLTINFIPEPSSLAALLAGLAGFGAVMRRRRKT